MPFVSTTGRAEFTWTGNNRTTTTSTTGNNNRTTTSTTGNNNRTTTSSTTGNINNNSETRVTRVTIATGSDITPAGHHSNHGDG